MRRALETELYDRWRGLAPGREDEPLAILGNVGGSLALRLQGLGPAGGELDPVVHRAGAARRGLAGGLHHASDVVSAAVKLEEDGIVGWMHPAVVLGFEKFAPDDVAVVAEAVGEVLVAGVEPHAG